MDRHPASELLAGLIGQVVIVDFVSTHLCIGTLAGLDEAFLDLRDADLHDCRDSTATREVYVFDSIRFGIRRNRTRVLIRRDDVVAITRFDDVSES